MKHLLPALFALLTFFYTGCAAAGNLAGTVLKTAGTVAKTAVTLPINTLSHYGMGN